MKDSFEEILDAVKKTRKFGPWVSKVSSEEYSKELLEEAKELVEAIEKKDNKNLQEEIGDLFWDLLILTIIAEEEGKINSKEAMKDLLEKRKRRTPYVFEGRMVPHEEAEKIWNEAKEKEKQR